MADIYGFFGTNRWLSNFQYAPVELDGQVYPSTEHAYQAAKTLNSKERLTIKYAETAAAAKRLGRKVTVRADWESIKLQVMYELCKQKFSNHADLREKLLATGDAYLEETNTWKDTFWGVYNGQGSNHLGKIIMRIRTELRNKTSSNS